MRERERESTMYKSANYLSHYGVLGMKWGQRRARHYAAKAKNAKAAGDRAKALEYANKSKKIEQKHTARAGSKEVYNRVKNQSTAKLVGKSLLMGTYGTLNYERLRAENKSKGLSFVAGVASQVGSNLTNHAMEIVEPRYTATAKNKLAKMKSK